MNKTTTTKNKTLGNTDKFIVSGQIIEHFYTKKNGVSTDMKELYFRASIQDYFIKFCESSVTKEALRPFIDKSVTVEAEIIDGNWDICPNDSEEIQSRIGYYMVIKKLL